MRYSIEFLYSSICLFIQLALGFAYMIIRATIDPVMNFRSVGIGDYLVLAQGDLFIYSILPGLLLFLVFQKKEENPASKIIYYSSRTAYVTDDFFKKNRFVMISSLCSILPPFITGVIRGLAAITWNKANGYCNITKSFLLQEWGLWKICAIICLFFLINSSLLILTYLCVDYLSGSFILGILAILAVYFGKKSLGQHNNIFSVSINYDHMNQPLYLLLNLFVTGMWCILFFVFLCMIFKRKEFY